MKAKEQIKAGIFFALILALPTVLRAQGEQWASNVIEFSSQFGVRQYSAQQILGKPNVLPNLGASPNAWAPKRKGREEYIVVGFETPIRIQQIAIAETHNPGGIRSITAYDRDDRAYEVHRFEPGYLPIEGRLLRIFIDPTDFEVHALKIVVDGKVLQGHFGIDAVAISGSNEPVSVDILISGEIASDYVPVALDSNVNSEYNELKPLLSPDGNTLYFSRQNHPENTGGIADDEDIWFSLRDSTTGNWTLAQNIGRPLNNRGPNFISSISQDGQSMLLLLGNAYYSKNRMTQGVSMSTRNEDDSWSNPINLVIEDDYNRSDKANYFMAPDNQSILMSVERRDSYGGRDLYVSFKQPDGSWTRPKNLGPTINTADEEASPFLATDGKTMFFSSKGFSGFGGFDIYMTRRLDDSWERWSEPENLGFTFNSSEDDIFFNFTENDEYAYFTRGTTRNTDIYKVKLPYYQKPGMLSPLFQGPPIAIRLRGRAFDAATRKPIEASLEFNRLMDTPKIELFFADTSGYTTMVSPGTRYAITARSEGYYNSEDSVEIGNFTVSAEVIKDFFLDPIAKNTAVVLKNVYFDFDSDVIRRESHPELNKITEMLLDNPTLDITIDGHTCSLGPDAYNQRLSERRARSIARYFIAQGIASDRIEYNGYGEERPIASNDTEETREINRRVEFKLVERGS